MVPRAPVFIRLVSPDIYFLKLWSLGRLYYQVGFPGDLFSKVHGPQGVYSYQVGFPRYLFSKVMVPRASVFIRLVSPEIYFLKLWSLGRLYLSG